MEITLNQITLTDSEIYLVRQMAQAEYSRLNIAGRATDLSQTQESNIAVNKEILESILSAVKYN